MSKAEQAISYLQQGFGCSQALLATYGTQFGLERDIALKLGEALAGGMGRTGGTCGVVTSALIILGLKHGRTKAEDKESQKKTDSLVKELLNKFSARNGSILCRDLLENDIGTPEGMKIARDKRLFMLLCPKFVRDASEILEQILEE